MQATILNFLIEGDEDTNPLLLFGGVLAAFLAICSMAYSDSCASQPEKEFSARLSSTSLSSALSLDQSVYKSLLSWDPSLAAGDTGAKKPSPPREIPASAVGGVNPWLLVSVLAGFLAGLWSPLSTFGRSKGSYPVDNPSVALFIFQLGAVAGVPLMLWYYGRVIHVHEKSPPSPPVLCSTYVAEAWNLPAGDKKYALLAGAIVSCGTYIFFTASQAISSTVAFAIGSCAPLVTIAIGVVVCRQLSGAPCLQTTFLALSTFLFVLAISLMVLASSI